MDTLHLEAVVTEPIFPAWLSGKDIQLFVLRLDRIDKEISGNKFFKLKYYLEAFPETGFSSIGTFGGAYSNHIAATAAACQRLHIPCRGIIRGEEPEIYSHTLQLAQRKGMRLHFVSRADYRDKKNLMARHPDVFWINEGGLGEEGVQGAATILENISDKHFFTHIISAVGTGTTVAGLIRAALPGQKVIGVSVMKANEELEKTIRAMAGISGQNDDFQLWQDYHFGGYARKNALLLEFMNQLWQETRLPTDFVYTAKAMYAVREEMEQGQIANGSKILFVHTGGLQGNLSLPPGSLAFLQCN